MYKLFTVISVVLPCFGALGQALPNYEVIPTGKSSPPNPAAFYAIFIDRKLEVVSDCQVGLTSTLPGAGWVGSCNKIDANFSGIRGSTVAVDYNHGTPSSPRTGFVPYNPIWIINQSTGKLKACGSPIGKNSNSKDGCVYPN